MTGSTPATTSARQYLYVAPGERGTAMLTSPHGESVVLVLSTMNGAKQVMIATPEGQPIESAGWKLTPLRSSSEKDL